MLLTILDYILHLFKEGTNSLQTAAFSSNTSSIYFSSCIRMKDQRCSLLASICLHVHILWFSPDYNCLGN